MVVWFTYDETGNQSWMPNSGAISNSTIRIPQLLQPVELLITDPDGTIKQSRDKIIFPSISKMKSNQNLNTRMESLFDTIIKAM
jgi:hypothetical protein